MKLKPIDYDDRQHAVYAAGRALTHDTLSIWMNLFDACAPPLRPLAVLDLGSGIGRFTPALADTFGGQTYGVEPSARMREIAQRDAAHPMVSYLAGRAEDIPLPRHSCDLVLMYLSFHHVGDREGAAHEIARVLRPGGRVLIRSHLSGCSPPIAWSHVFPRWQAVETAMFPTVGDIEAAFARTGLRILGLESLEEELAASLEAYVERLRLRAISVFEHLTEAEIEQGFRDLDAAVMADLSPGPILARADTLILG